MEQLTKQQNKVNNFLLTGLKTLRHGLTTLSIEEFVVNTLAILMLIERDEYLQSLKDNNFQDKGNGSYPRSFK